MWIWSRSRVWEDPLEEDMATHSNICAWRIPWIEKPGRLQSIVSQRVGHDDWSDLAAVAVMFSTVAVPIYVPTNSVGGSPFLHTLSSIYCWWIFYGGFPGGASDWMAFFVLRMFVHPPYVTHNKKWIAYDFYLTSFFLMCIFGVFLTKLEISQLLIFNPKYPSCQLWNFQLWSFYAVIYINNQNNRS